MPDRIESPQDELAAIMGNGLNHMPDELENIPEDSSPDPIVEENLEPEPESSPSQTLSDFMGGKEKEFDPTSIEIPEDEDEFNELISNLSEGDLTKLMEHINSEEEGSQVESNEEGDVPPEGEGDKGEGKEDGQVTVPFGLESAEFDSLPSELKEKLQSKYEEISPWLEFEASQLSEGIKLVESDPVMKFRLGILSGQEKGMTDQQIAQAFTPEALQTLGLDFVGDKKNSFNKMANYTRELVMQATNGIVEHYEGQINREAYQGKLDNEFKNIMAAAKMETDLPYSDPKHPLREFMNWAGEMDGSIDVVKLGGLAAYNAFLSATGKSEGLVKDAMVAGERNALEKLRKADQSVKTLPRSTAPSKKQTDGSIDVQRLRTDMDYMNSLMNRYHNNPRMLRKLEDLAIREE